MVTELQVFVLVQVTVSSPLVLQHVLVLVSVRM